MVNSGPPCQRRLLILYHRLCPYVSQSLLWFLSLPSESAVGLRGAPVVAYDRYGFLRLCTPLGSDELLGCHGHYQSFFGYTPSGR
jgi:hypothetical protein